MIALYSRVSTQEQAREGYSIEEQQSRLKAFSDAMGWYNTKQYVDAGYSGGNRARPALQKLVADVESGRVEKVVVFKLDRLSRSQKDTLDLIEDVFLRNGCDFVSMSENFDTGTSFGRAMIGILAVFAQLEREQIRERMSIGREGRAKAGKYHGGGRQPVGYDYVDGVLKVNEYEAMQIRELHRLFQSGYTFRGIVREFSERGYKHKGGEWQPKRVKETLTSKLYLGYVSYRGEYFKGQHEAIIDSETYSKSMSLYNAKDFSKYKNNGFSSYLAGLIWCGRCGARYTMVRYDKYRYYTCYSRRKISMPMVKDASCKNDNFKAEHLDAVVFDEIRKLQTDPNYVLELRSQNNDLDAEEKKSEVLRKEIEKLDAQRSRLIDLYGLGGFSVEELQEKVEELEKQRERLQDDLEELEKEKPAVGVDEVREMVKSFSDILDRGKYEEIRVVLESLIRRIEIDGDNITIYWTFA